MPHLVVDTDDLVAFVTLAAKFGFVTLGTISMFVFGYITLTNETFIALPAIEVICVPIFVHCPSRFVTEDELQNNR